MWLGYRASDHCSILFLLVKLQFDKLIFPLKYWIKYRYLDGTVKVILVPLLPLFQTNSGAINSYRFLNKCTFTFGIGICKDLEDKIVSSVLHGIEMQGLNKPLLLKTWEDSKAFYKEIICICIYCVYLKAIVVQHQHYYPHVWHPRHTSYIICNITDTAWKYLLKYFNFDMFSTYQSSQKILNCNGRVRSVFRIRHLRAFGAHRRQNHWVSFPWRTKKF